MGKRLNSCVQSGPVSISGTIPYDSLGSIYVFLSELDRMRHKMTHGHSVLQSFAAETIDSSEEETDTSQPRRTIKMKKIYATDELAQFLVTGPTDATNKVKEVYCLKDVSVLTHGISEVLRNFQGNRLFARDQRLRLQTHEWPVLDSCGIPLTEDELDRQRKKTFCALLVFRDCE